MVSTLKKHKLQISSALAIAGAVTLPLVSFAQSAPTSGDVAADVNTYIGVYWQFVLAILGSMVLFAVTNAVLFLAIYFVLRRLHLIH